MMFDILNDMKQGGCRRIADGLRAADDATSALRVPAAAGPRRTITGTGSTASDRRSPNTEGTPDSSAGGARLIARGIDLRSASAASGLPDGFAGAAGALPRGIDRRNPSPTGGDPDDFAGEARVLLLVMDRRSHGLGRRDPDGSARGTRVLAPGIHRSHGGVADRPGQSGIVDDPSDH